MTIAADLGRKATANIQLSGTEMVSFDKRSIDISDKFYLLFLSTKSRKRQSDIRVPENWIDLNL